MVKDEKKFRRETNIVYIENKGRSRNFFQLDHHKIVKELMNILKSSQDAYQKKIALFNFLKDLEVVKLEVNEEQRTNCLLEGKLYNEIAKQKMREYKRLTVEEFSKAE
jgi:hypothetical protein